MPFLHLGTKRVEYVVLKGTSRRYTYLRLRPDLKLEVVVPRGTTVDVEKTIRDRTRWLEREYDRLSSTKNVLENDMVMIGGRLLKLVHVTGHSEGIAVNWERGTVEMCANERKRIKELLRRWFLKESSAYVVRKVSELSPVVGARPTRVDVREISKWGYCTRTGRISFSWQLAALSERLREYVVLHELTHLLEFNHSASFRLKLGKVCPDFREREKELGLIVPYDRLAPP